MKKLALVLCLALALPACATLQKAESLIGFATAGIANPVTKDMLNNAESGAIIVFAALGAYKRSCIAGAIPPVCRVNIAKTQVYTRKLPSLLSDLRKFVRTNDQVNAVIAYNTIQQMVADVRAVAAANNIQVQ